MAAVSHLKNKKEAKQRESLEKVSGIVNNARVDTLTEGGAF